MSSNHNPQKIHSTSSDVHKKEKKSISEIEEMAPYTQDDGSIVLGKKGFIKKGDFEYKVRREEGDTAVSVKNIMGSYSNYKNPMPLEQYSFSSGFSVRRNSSNWFIDNSSVTDVHINQNNQLEVLLSHVDGVEGDNGRRLIKNPLVVRAVKEALYRVRQDSKMTKDEFRELGALEKILANPVKEKDLGSYDLIVETGADYRALISSAYKIAPTVESKLQEKQVLSAFDKMQNKVINSPEGGRYEIKTREMVRVDATGSKVYLSESNNGGMDNAPQKAILVETMERQLNYCLSAVSDTYFVLGKTGDPKEMLEKHHTTRLEDRYFDLNRYNNPIIAKKIQALVNNIKQDGVLSREEAAGFEHLIIKLDQAVAGATKGIWPSYMETGSAFIPIPLSVFDAYDEGVKECRKNAKYSKNQDTANKAGEIVTDRQGDESYVHNNHTVYVGAKLKNRVDGLVAVNAPPVKWEKDALPARSSASKDDNFITKGIEKFKAFISEDARSNTHYPYANIVMKPVPNLREIELSSTVDTPTTDNSGDGYFELLWRNMKARYENVGKKGTTISARSNGDISYTVDIPNDTDAMCYYYSGLGELATILPKISEKRDVNYGRQYKDPHVTAVLESALSDALSDNKLTPKELKALNNLGRTMATIFEATPNGGLLSKSDIGKIDNAAKAVSAASRATAHH